MLPEDGLLSRLRKCFKHSVLVVQVVSSTLTIASFASAHSLIHICWLMAILRQIPVR